MSKQEQSPLPWKVIETPLRHVGSKAVVDKNGSTVITVTRTEDAELIVEACNNYERLKAENQRLREALQGMIGILTPKQREKQFPNLYKKAIGALQQEGGSQ